MPVCHHSWVHLFAAFFPHLVSHFLPHVGFILAPLPGAKMGGKKAICQNKQLRSWRLSLHVVLPRWSARIVSVQQFSVSWPKYCCTAPVIMCFWIKWFAPHRQTRKFPSLWSGKNCLTASPSLHHYKCFLHLTGWTHHSFGCYWSFRLIKKTYISPLLALSTYSAKQSGQDWPMLRQNHTSFYVRKTRVKVVIQQVFGV